MSTSRNEPAREYAPIVDDVEHDSDSDSSEDIPIHGTDYRRYGTREPSADRARRRSFIEEDREALQIAIPPREEKMEKPVTWRSLPNKRQLAILVIARLSEPLVQSSLRVSLPLLKNRIHTNSE